VIGVRGYALPDGEPVELYADGDRWTTDPVPAAELVAEGWIIPGLVDVHTHPGAERPDLPLSEAVLREDLERHLRAGVTAIRSPGLAGDPPAWFGTDPGLPRAWHAGPWLAPEGGFFEGGGRQVPLARLPELAARQAAATGWAKLVGDWTEPVPAATIIEVARRVRAVGGRIAVHSQDPDSSRAAVAAGVDSIEHGQHLDPSLLDRMAAGSIALVPTLSAFQAVVPEVAAREPSERRDRWLAGTAAMGPMAAAAHEAGVRVLAGTDDPDRHGRVAAEARALAEAGLPAHAALGAAAWAAREFLGLGGLEEGGPADAVVYDRDPRTDLGVLDHPVRVILRGRVVV
jgi:imidazolonepropionase-like amidohydrolase